MSRFHELSLGDNQPKTTKAAEVGSEGKPRTKTLHYLGHWGNGFSPQFL